MDAAPGGTQGGTRRYSVPETARLLGISERAVRKRIEAGTLAAEQEEEGKPWTVFLPIEAVPQAVPGDPEGGTHGGNGAVPPEPEAFTPSYRVTPAEIEQAIERTGAKYIADLQTMFDQVGRLYEARLADKEQVIASQAETIAELRRRAEVAEGEVAALKAEPVPPAVIITTEQPAAATPAPRRRWWQFWG